MPHDLIIEKLIKPEQKEGKEKRIYIHFQLVFALRVQRPDNGRKLLPALWRLEPAGVLLVMAPHLNASSIYLVHRTLCEVLGSKKFKLWPCIEECASGEERTGKVALCSASGPLTHHLPGTVILRAKPVLGVRILAITQLDGYRQEQEGRKWVLPPSPVG